MPVPTVAEVLKSTGMDDAAIAAMDKKILEGFSTVLTTAEAERQQAELAQRAATEYFDTTITPALNEWGVREANIAAERDYYKTMATKAKDGGFIMDVPPFQAAQPPAGGQPPRNDNGQFRPNGNPVPGSPDLSQLENQLGNAFSTMSDLQWQYQTLFGKVMPDSPSTLAAEARAQRMTLPDYAAKKYGFAERKTAIANEEKQKAEEAIRKDEREARDKYWAERGGANPNVRQAETSRFSELRKGVSEGTRQDPLKMDRAARHAATSAAIKQEIAATANS